MITKLCWGSAVRIFLERKLSTLTKIKNICITFGSWEEMDWSKGSKDGPLGCHWCSISWSGWRLQGYSVCEILSYNFRMCSVCVCINMHTCNLNYKNRLKIYKSSKRTISLPAFCFIEIYATVNRFKSKHLWQCCFMAKDWKQSRYQSRGKSMNKLCNTHTEAHTLEKKYLELYRLTWRCRNQ